MGVRHHDYIMVSVIFQINGACRFSPVSFIRAIIQFTYVIEEIILVVCKNTHFTNIYVRSSKNCVRFIKERTEKKCVKINIHILWGYLLKINYVKIWKIILIINYFNVYNHILSKLSLKKTSWFSDLVVSREVYFLSRHNVMLHHCARSAPRHLRHDVAKGDNVYIGRSVLTTAS